MISDSQIISSIGLHSPESPARFFYVYEYQRILFVLFVGHIEHRGIFFTFQPQSLSIVISGFTVAPVIHGRSSPLIWSRLLLFVWEITCVESAPASESKLSLFLAFLCSMTGMEGVHPKLWNSAVLFPMHYFR